MVQERPVQVERRLSAILAADVADYSRLMHSDEEATHAKLTALLTDAVAPAIAEHSGRIVKNTGDGFLAEFPSAVEAVRAALQFQARIKELTIGELEDRRIAFRVGINIGDVIAESHDIFGDDVNIAARLESIAAPGGICVSSSVYDYVRGKVWVEFADLGSRASKTSPARSELIPFSGMLDFDIDATLTGFSTGEIDVIISSADDPDDEVIPPVPTTPRTKPGDIWILGDHRVGCGDGRDAGFLQKLIGDGARVDAACP
jgi:class 3 adenylate cyclase